MHQKNTNDKTISPAEEMVFATSYNLLSASEGVYLSSEEMNMEHGEIGIADEFSRVAVESFVEKVSNFIREDGQCEIRIVSYLRTATHTLAKKIQQVQIQHDRAADDVRRRLKSIAPDKEIQKAMVLMEVRRKLLLQLRTFFPDIKFEARNLGRWIKEHPEVLPDLNIETDVVNCLYKDEIETLRSPSIPSLRDIADSLSKECPEYKNACRYAVRAQRLRLKRSLAT